MFLFPRNWPSQKYELSNFSDPVSLSLSPAAPVNPAVSQIHDGGIDSVDQKSVAIATTAAMTFIFIVTTFTARKAPTAISTLPL